MDLVCFDTQIIIWGVKEQATLGQEHKIEQAQTLIQTCEDTGTQIMLPAVVVAEVLCSLEPAIHNEFNALIQRLFVVAPFDTQAAAHFAVMWRMSKQLHGKTGISRAEMKADFMIVATAIARNARCIYSEDVGLKKFAQGYIDVYSFADN